MAVVTAAQEWTGIEDSDDEPLPLPNERHATESFKRRESRISDIALPTLQSEGCLSADKQVEVHLAVREWSPSFGGFDDVDEGEGSPARDRAATESFKRRESRLAAAAADAELVLADKEVDLVTQGTDWKGAGDDDSDDDGPVMQLMATELFKRRETRLLQAPDLHDDRIFGDVQLDIVPQGKEWAHLGDSDDESPARENHAAAVFHRRESRIVNAAALAPGTMIADKEVSLHTASGWEHDDNSSDDDGPVMDLIATEVFRRRETRLMNAPDLHDDRVFGDVQLDIVKAGKDWADGGDSDDDVAAAAEQAYAKREKRFSIAATGNQDQVIVDKVVGLLAQTKDWRHDDSDSDSDGPVMDLIATEVFKRRETRLLNAPDLHDDRVIGDVQMDVVKNNQEWAQDVETDDDGEAEVHEMKTFKRRETRIENAVVLTEEQVLGDKEVSLHTQDTDWRQDSDSDEEPVEARVTEAFKRRESRIATAPVLDDDRIVGDVQVGVVDHGGEWADAADSGDEAEEPERERAASICFQKRESRIVGILAAEQQDRVMGDVEVSVQDHKTDWRHEDDSDDEGSPTAEAVAASAFERREKRLSVVVPPGAGAT